MDENKTITMEPTELSDLIETTKSAAYNEGYVKASEEAKAKQPLAISVGNDRSDGVKIGRFLFNLAKEAKKQTNDSINFDWNDSGFQKTGKNESVIKALGISEVGTGGAWVPDDFASEIIPMLKPFSAVRSTGVRVEPLANGRRTYKRNTSGSTAYWVAAGGTITSSSPGAGAYEMLTKKAGAIVGIQNELLRYGGNDLIFQTVQDDMLREVARLEDVAFLLGTGTNGAPKGILHWTASGNQFDSTGSSSPTTATRRADLVKAAGLPRRANVPVIDPAVFMNGRTYYDLLAAVDANSNPAFERYLLTGTLFGYRIVVTENISSPVAGSYVIFADMGQAVIGQGLATQIEFFPNATWSEAGTITSGISTDQSAFRVLTESDFMLRYDTAASVINKVIWGA